MITATDIVDHLRTLRNPRDIEGQRRYGIAPKGEHLGIRAPVLREIARQHRRDHALALELWTTGLHEARVLAALIDDPARVTRAQMEQWARECDNWGVTDACCCVLFDRTTFAIEKAHRWSRRRAEFVKRSGFVLMAGLAVHRKELPDKVFLGFLPIIRREATDGRNFVKKAVNWALRQIGKRNPPCAAPRSRRQNEFTGSIRRPRAGLPPTRFGNCGSNNRPAAGAGKFLGMRRVWLARVNQRLLIARNPPRCRGRAAAARCWAGRIQ